VHAFRLEDEQEFNPAIHVEKILGREGRGDFTVACWEPGQVSPNHCHPDATEIYFCFQGGGTMKTPDRTVDVKPGGFVVHPPGEVHEYTNGSERTLLFRVRYGTDMVSRKVDWPTNTSWTQSAEDAAYFAANPVG
jgi:quercetin dioxygenase-like cupin family protein